MLRPRFTIRTFLVVCLLLGAMAIPQARKWHMRRVEVAARAERIEVEEATRSLQSKYDQLKAELAELQGE